MRTKFFDASWARRGGCVYEEPDPIDSRNCVLVGDGIQERYTSAKSSASISSIALGRHITISLFLMSLLPHRLGFGFLCQLENFLYTEHKSSTQSNPLASLTKLTSTEKLVGFFQLLPQNGILTLRRLKSTIDLPRVALGRGRKVLASIDRRVQQRVYMREPGTVPSSGELSFDYRFRLIGCGAICDGEAAAARLTSSRFLCVQPCESTDVGPMFQKQSHIPLQSSIPACFQSASIHQHHEF